MKLALATPTAMVATAVTAKISEEMTGRIGAAPSSRCFRFTVSTTAT
jgi:hypothetical protein